MSTEKFWNMFHKKLHQMAMSSRFFLWHDEIQKQKMMYFDMKFSITKKEVLQVEIKG